MTDSATFEIHVEDGDEENSLAVPIRDLPGLWVDAHRLREDWDRDDTLLEAASDFLRDMARDGMIPRRLPECTMVMTLALLHDILSPVQLARANAMLAMPGTVLHLRFPPEGPPTCDVRFARGDHSTVH